METINFTRGVPANESFPLEEVASAAIDALKARGPAMLQYTVRPPGSDHFVSGLRSGRACRATAC